MSFPGVFQEFFQENYNFHHEFFTFSTDEMYCNQICTANRTTLGHIFHAKLVEVDG